MCQPFFLFRKTSHSSLGHSHILAMLSICVMFQFCPLLFFSIFPLPFQSHGLSPDLSPDFHHMTALIVLTFLLSHNLLSASLGDAIVLLTIVLFHHCSPLLFLLSIVPQDPLFALLECLVMVAASVVYKPCLYHRRGLKPDLVF